MTDTIDRILPISNDDIIDTEVVAGIPKRIGRNEAIAVHKAAQLLDSFTPDWYTRINTLTIDLCSTKRCVLGQVYGSFGDGLKYMLLHHTYNDINVFIPWGLWQARQTKKAWRKEIRARR